MPKMILFLYGEDTYSSRQKLNEIIGHYKETNQKSLNLKFFEAKSLDFNDFQKELQTLSIFQDKKFFILYEVFANQSFKEEFVKNFKKIAVSAVTILFYETKGSFPKDSFFTFLNKNATVQEFTSPTGSKLRSWLKEEFEKKKVRVAPMVLESLISAIGEDLWGLSNEVSKLASFAKNREISLADVKNLVKSKVETDIFETIDAIAVKDKKKALLLLRRHLERGDSPVYLLSMINFQFRNLLIIKDLIGRGKAISASGLNPFVARKSQALVGKFTFEELKKIYQKIFLIDYETKTGKNDPETALDLLVAGI
jgi:DNA polymerase-3 subunit delta